MPSREQLRTLGRKALSLALWVPFALFSLVAVMVAPAAVIFERWTYARDLGRGMDKLGAAVLGWGGDYTISAECGARRKACRFCRVVCRILDLVDPGHCPGAAEHEGLQ